MGEPIRIIDIAQRMIRLAGLVPDKDVAIQVVGPRPGEKLEEELFNADENVAKADLAGVLRAVTQALPLSRITAAIERLEVAAGEHDTASVLGGLADLVRGYSPSAEFRANMDALSTPRCAAGASVVELEASAHG